MKQHDDEEGEIMGYYSDFSGKVILDIDKVISILEEDSMNKQSATAVLAENIKNALDVPGKRTYRDLLEQVYDDWCAVFGSDAYRNDMYDDLGKFVKKGEISTLVSNVKLYNFSHDLKAFFEKYRDAITYLYAERYGEENKDIERFEVRNENGKNVLYVGKPVITFEYSPL